VVITVSDEESRDYIRVFEYVYERDIYVFMDYFFVDEPFICLRWEHRFGGGLCKGDMIPSPHGRFNFPCIYYRDDRFRFDIESDIYGVQVWFGRIHGEDILTAEPLIKLINDSPTIGDETVWLLRKLVKYGALKSFTHTLRLAMKGMGGLAKVILTVLRDKEIRESIYDRIHKKDLEVCEPGNPECFYKMSEFIRDIKNIGLWIPRSNNLMRKILRIIKEIANRKP